MAPRKQDTPEFAAFWKVYPRPVGKPSARAAFTKALRTASPDEIMNGLMRYAFSPDEQRQPHPSTWLNDERWVIEAPRKPPTMIVNGNGKPTSMDSTRALASIFEPEPSIPEWVTGPTIDHDPGDYR